MLKRSESAMSSVAVSEASQRLQPVSTAQVCDPYHVHTDSLRNSARTVVASLPLSQNRSR